MAVKVRATTMSLEAFFSELDGLLPSVVCDRMAQFQYVVSSSVLRPHDEETTAEDLILVYTDNGRVIGSIGIGAAFATPSVSVSPSPDPGCAPFFQKLVEIGMVGVSQRSTLSHLVLVTQERTAGLRSPDVSRSETPVDLYKM
jgi:hypothetical protein